MAGHQGVSLTQLARFAGIGEARTSTRLTKLAERGLYRRLSEAEQRPRAVTVRATYGVADQGAGARTYHATGDRAAGTATRNCGSESARLCPRRSRRPRGSPSALTSGKRIGHRAHKRRRKSSHFLLIDWMLRRPEARQLGRPRCDAGRPNRERSSAPAVLLALLEVAGAA